MCIDTEGKQSTTMVRGTQAKPNIPTTAQSLTKIQLTSQHEASEEGGIQKEGEAGTFPVTATFLTQSICFIFTTPSVLLGTSDGIIMQQMHLKDATVLLSMLSSLRLLFRIVSGFPVFPSDPCFLR